MTSAAASMLASRLLDTSSAKATPTTERRKAAQRNAPQRVLDFIRRNVGRAASQCPAFRIGVEDPRRLPCFTAPRRRSSTLIPMLFVVVERHAEAQPEAWGED